MRAGGAQCRAVAGSAAVTTAGGTPRWRRRSARPPSAAGSCCSTTTCGAPTAPDQPVPGRQRRVDRLRQLPHPAVQRRTDGRAHGRVGHLERAEHQPLLEPAAVAVLRAVAAHVPADPRDVPEQAHRRAELRRRAVDRRLVDAVPGLRQGQQRRARHLQLALATRGPGGQRGHGEPDAGLAGHRAPAAVPDQRVRSDRRAEPG